MKKWVTVGILTGLIIGLALMSGCISAPPPSKSTVPVAPITIIGNFEVIESHLEINGYGTYVVGQIRNNADRTYNIVRINITLYDSSGAQVGSAHAFRKNLDPNGVWNFIASSTAKHAIYYKIAEISGD